MPPIIKTDPDPVYELEVNKLREAWKDFKLEGAEILFGYSKVPELNPDWIWPDGLDVDNIPDEAYTGRLIDKYSVGWKATINGEKYGHYIVLTNPTANKDAMEALRASYESAFS